MLRYKLFYFMLYVSFTTHHFLNLYFRDIGLTGLEIGTIKALSAVVMILSQPIWGCLCDIFRMRKSLLKILLSFSAILFFLVSVRDNFYWIFLIIGMYGFFKSPIVPVADSIVMIELNGDGRRYSQIRLWGGLGLSVSVFFMGYYFNQSNLQNLFAVYTLFTLLACGIAFVLPQRRCSFTKGKLKIKDFWCLLRYKDFLLFLAAILFLQTGAFIIDGFFGLFVKEKIGNEVTLGWALTIAGISEVIVYYCLGKGKSITQPCRLLMISAFTSALRWFLYARSTLVIQIMFLQALHGITFGFFYISSVTYVDRILSHDFATSAQTLLWAIAFGVASVLGSILGGYLYDWWNYQVLFLVASGLALFSLGILVIIKRTVRVK